MKASIGRKQRRASLSATRIWSISWRSRTVSVFHNADSLSILLIALDSRFHWVSRSNTLAEERHEVAAILPRDVHFPQPYADDSAVLLPREVHAHDLEHIAAKFRLPAHVCLEK